MKRKLWGVASNPAQLVKDGNDTVAVVVNPSWRLYEDQNEAWQELIASMIQITRGSSSLTGKRSAIVCDISRTVWDDCTNTLTHFATTSFTRTHSLWFEGRRWSAGEFEVDGVKGVAYGNVTMDGGATFTPYWYVSRAELEWAFDTFEYAPKCARLRDEVTKYFTENTSWHSLAYDVVSFMGEFGEIHGDTSGKTPLGISLDNGRSYRTPGELSDAELSDNTWELITRSLDEVLCADLHAAGFPDTAAGRRNFLTAYLARAGVIVIG